jgi:hypothetical protein
VLHVFPFLSGAFVSQVFAQGSCQEALVESKSGTAKRRTAQHRVLYPGSFGGGTDRWKMDGLLSAPCEAFWLSDLRDRSSRDRLADVKSPVILSKRTVQRA